MKEPVICYVELFDAKQRVITPTGEIIESTMDDLAKALVDACDYSGTTNIHLFGNKSFCENRLKPEITQYSNKKIRMEIN